MRLIPPALYRRLAHRTYLVRILDNLGWLFVDKVLRLGLGLLVGVWMARYLGPADFGTYNYVLAFVGVFGGVATLGLPVIVVRELVRDAGNAGEILGTAFVMLLGGAVLTLLAILLAVGLLRGDDPLVRGAVAVLAAGLVFQSSMVVKFWFEAQVLSRYVVWVESLVSVLAAAAKAAMIWLGASLMAFVWALLLEAVVIAALLLAVYARQTGALRSWRARWSRARSLMHNAWPIVFSGAVLMVQARVDQLMLAEIAGQAQVGYYSVALRVAEAVVLFAVILQSTLYPVLVQSKAQSQAVYEERLVDYYRLGFLAALALCLPIAVFGQQIIDLVFGAAYQPSGLLLMLMSGRIFLAFLGTARGVFLLIENMQSYAAFTIVIGTLSNIALNLLLIPRWQGVGAVVASLLSFTITLVIVDLFFAKPRANMKLMLHAALTLHRVRGWR